MHRRYNLAHLILANVVALGLTLLMVTVETPAQIAFVSDRDGNPEISVMDADGRNQRRLTNTPPADWNPSWSPDGTRIVFVSEREGNFAGKRSQIYVIDADGKNLRKLSRNPFAEWDPAWSPDGTRIAFTSNVDFHNHIYVMDAADGRNLRRIGQHEQVGWDPSWSPDGERIAFTSWSNLDFPGLGNWEIYVMDANGSNQQRLTENPGHESDPSWSPDGERIAFVSTGDWRNYEISVMDADGKNQRRLTRNPARDWHPSWSPDGERIAFASNRDGNYEIYVMNADGARQVRKRTKDGSDNTDPAWFDPAFAVEVAPFAVAPTGKKLTMWSWLKQVD